MGEERSKLSRGWFMFYLGQVMGQQETLFEKARTLVNEMEKPDGSENADANVLPRIEELVELTKKYQNNAALLMARCEMWRLDWKQEHGQTPEPPEEKP